MDWAFHESQTASTFAQNAKSRSGYSATRREFCKIGLRGVGRRPDQTSRYS
jgi:hypothetical protein